MEKDVCFQMYHDTILDGAIVRLPNIINTGHHLNSFLAESMKSW